MGRYEWKFAVPEGDIDQLRCVVSRYLTPDTHGPHGDGVYTVRSIYFDTSVLTAYHEKIAGVRQRRKVRMRAYDTPDSATEVFLEIKYKDDATISKVRSAIRYADLDRLFLRGSPSGSIASDSADSSGVRQFLFNVRRHALRPVVLIRYERSAFYARSGLPLRVTIDQKVCAAPRPGIGDLFADVPVYEAFPGFAILEAKFPIRMPPWLETTVDRGGYERAAISKFALGIEACGIVSNRFPAVSSRQIASLTERQKP